MPRRSRGQKQLSLESGGSYSSTPLGNVLSDGHGTGMAWYSQPLGLKAREGKAGVPAAQLQKWALAMKLPPAAMATLCGKAFWSKRWQADTGSAGRLLPNLAPLPSNQDGSTEVHCSTEAGKLAENSSAASCFSDSWHEFSLGWGWGEESLIIFPIITSEQLGIYSPSTRLRCGKWITLKGKTRQTCRGYSTYRLQTAWRGAPPTAEFCPEQASYFLCGVPAR